MRTSTHLSRVLMITALLAAAGCGSDDTSNASSNAPRALVQTADEPAGGNCAAGGIKLETGLDTNGDGALAGAEIKNTSYVCAGASGVDGTNGTDGTSGTSALVAFADEPAGDNCAAGGQRVAWGTDDDGDGTLSAGEEDGSRFVCHGVAGAASLVITSAELPGASCGAGGVRVDSGADADGNGTLDAGEITSTSYACNAADGLDALIAVSDEPAGATCAEGGQRIDYGQDDSRDGALDAGEIDGTRYVCNGLAGTSTLVSAAAEPAGGACAAGGQRLSWGADTSGDGTLDASEVTGSAVVCDGATGTPGAPGLNALVRTTPEPAGATCADGGVKIETGVDDDGDGVLAASEIDATSYACDGADGAAGQAGLNTLTRSAAEPAGANCANGGLRVATGLDDNRNGTLESAEVDNTAFVCNGAPGAAGQNGLSALIATTAEPAGANCAYGGQRIDYGLDDDSNGALATAEVDGTAYVCNGRIGVDPQCTQPYTTLDRADRNISFNDGNGNVEVGDGNGSGAGNSPQWVGPGWYRFNGAAGTRMPESAPPIYACGTDAPGWLNGVHPATTDGIVARQACFNWSGNTCRWSSNIQVVNCGGFYLYNLVVPSEQVLRYCGE